MVFDPIYLGFDRHQVFLCECPTTQGFHGNHPSTRTSSCSVARPWWRWLLYSGAFMVGYSSTRSVSCPASRFFFKICSTIRAFTGLYMPQGGIFTGLRTPLGGIIYSIASMRAFTRLLSSGWDSVYLTKATVLARSESNSYHSAS